MLCAVHFKQGAFRNKGVMCSRFICCGNAWFYSNYEGLIW